MIVFVGIFDNFYAEKDGSEKHRQQYHHDLPHPVVPLREIDCHSHRQTADDQNERVEAAPKCVEVIRTGGERHREFRSIDEIRRKEPAEEHDLLHEEHPHSDRDALFLLSHIVELVLKPGLVINEFV